MPVGPVAMEIYEQLSTVLLAAKEVKRRRRIMLVQSVPMLNSTAAAWRRLGSKGSPIPLKCGGSDVLRCWWTGDPIPDGQALAIPGTDKVCIAQTRSSTAKAPRRRRPQRPHTAPGSRNSGARAHNLHCRALLLLLLISGGWPARPDQVAEQG